MADFNVELSPAQNAGANQISPVQVQPVQSLDMNPFIEKGLSIFSSIAGNLQQKEADARKKAVVTEYLTQAGQIADQRRAGIIDPSKASTLDQALYYKTITANADLLPDLEKARKSLFEGTATGETADLVKEKKDREKALDALAMSYGLPVSQDLTPETRALYWQAASVMKQSEESLKRLTASQNYVNAGKGEARAEEKHLSEVEKRHQEATAEAGMRDMVVTNYDAFASYVKDKLKEADTPEQMQNAKLLIGERLNDIRAAALAQPGTAKIMENYLTPFDSLAKFAIEQMKPGMKLETLQQQFNEKIAGAKLVFLQDPETLAAVAGNALVSNAPMALGRAQVAITRGITAVTSALSSTPLYKLPPIVGTSGQQATYDAFSEAMKKLQSGTVTGDQTKLSTELGNGLSVILRQTEAMGNDKQVNPADLGKVMEFFSKDEFGAAVKAGTVPVEATAGAFKALTVYSEAVVNRITQDLNASVTQARPRQTASSVADHIKDIRFEGGKIVLVPVDGPYNERDQRKTADIFDKSGAALTRLIRVGAHMEGTTDYGKWWNENRHRIMPTVYADPKEFPAGFVNPKTGWKFKGGMFYNKNNWEKPAGGSAQ